MKAAPTYVFMLVPIPSELIGHPLVAGHSSFGQTGSSPANGKRNGRSQWGERPCQRCDTQSLPSHLFWTWFVDNPRPRSNPS
jgi:hypothetical protein